MITNNNSWSLGPTPNKSLDPAPRAVAVGVTAPQAVAVGVTAPQAVAVGVTIEPSIPSPLPRDPSLAPASWTAVVLYRFPNGAPNRFILSALHHRGTNTLTGNRPKPSQAPGIEQRLLSVGLLSTFVITLSLITKRPSFLRKTKISTYFFQPVSPRLPGRSFPLTTNHYLNL